MAEASEITIGSHVVVTAEGAEVRPGVVIWMTDAGYVEVRFFKGEIGWFPLSQVVLADAPI